KIKQTLYISEYFRKMSYNGSGLCEVAGNRRRKFRFRRHVAKANFYLLIYEKKPIKLAFADYEDENFQLRRKPAILQNPCYRLAYYRFIISIAFSKTSSFPSLMPLIVGFTVISGTIPIRCVSVPSG